MPPTPPAETAGDTPGNPATGSAASRGSAWEVFAVFLRLGLTSFGGPIAHLGYFRTEFVERRRWLDEAGYADLVALCQFLPGPASSQVGLAVGHWRAGWPGALAAWVGFTLPSALALVLFAYGVTQWTALAQSGAIHGLKLAAVAVVAQAVLGMAKGLCPDRQRAGVAVGAALLATAAPSALGQIAAIVAGGIVGVTLLRLGPLPPTAHRAFGIGKPLGAALLAVLAALLVALPLIAQASGSSVWAAVSTFYRAGALVFGGGHVVLPLLQSGVVPPGLVTNDAFLAGYGAAQAVPGPLFTFAAYLGAVMPGPMGGLAGGAVALVAIFVPAALLVFGALPFWEALRTRAPMQRAMAGVNAAVVGILGAALYDPVWTSAVGSRTDFAVALAAFGLLVFGRVPPLAVVAAAAGAGLVLAG